MRLYLVIGEIAHVAQLVEHFLGKGEVTGSNPVAGSNNWAGGSISDSAY